MKKKPDEKETKVPKQITLGVGGKSYWKKLFELCQKAKRRPSDIIHMVLDKWMPDEVKLLEMEIEFQAKLEEERKKLESKKKGQP